MPISGGVSGGGGSSAAEDITITDTGAYYTGSDVEAALAEIGAGGIGGGGGGGGGAVGWTQDVDESGASFAGFTAAAGGTWSSNGTEIIQTETSAAWRRAKYNTLIPVGFPAILESEIYITSGERGAIGLTDGTNAGGLSVQLIVGSGVKVDVDATTELRLITATIATGTWYKVRIVLGNVWASVYLDGTLIGNVPIGRSVTWDLDAEYFSLLSYAGSVKWRNIKVWTLSSDIVRAAVDYDVSPTPTANDDEFKTAVSGSAPSGWTLFQTPTTIDADTTFKSHLYVKKTATSGATGHVGIYKAWTPGAGECYSTKITDMVYTRVNYQRGGGISIGEANPVTGKTNNFWVVDNSSGPVLGVTHYTAAGTFSSSLYTGAYPGYAGPIYLRIRYNSPTSVDYQFSRNGVVWTTLLNHNPGFTVGSIALTTETANATNDSEAVWDWIRFGSGVVVQSDAILWQNVGGGIGVQSTVAIVIDGGGSAIATGVVADIEMPFSGTITACRVLADQTGSLVVDLWKDTYANFPPTDADSITASAPPTLSSSAKSEDTTLTGWTTAFSAGDIVRVNVDSATTVTRVTVSLTVTRS